MHGSSICFNLLMELPTPHHQLGAHVCTGLPPDNGSVLRTFFHQEKGNRHAPCKVSMESSAIYCCCWQVMAFCPLDGLFHNKGAPHSHAHIQTLMIMVDLGENKLSHTFIATSCPFQLCYRKWHVKMSKWSWQLWWWAIWGKWDQNNDEVADDVDADDRNICKAIAFRLWNIPPKVSLLSICGFLEKRLGWGISYVFGYLIVTAINQSINLSSKAGCWGWSYFSKKEGKNLLLYL